MDNTITETSSFNEYVTISDQTGEMNYIQNIQKWKVILLPFCNTSELNIEDVLLKFLNENNMNIKHMYVKSLHIPSMIFGIYILQKGINMVNGINMDNLSLLKKQINNLNNIHMFININCTLYNIIRYAFTFKPYI